MSLRLTLAFIRLHAANCVERWSVIKTLTLAAIIIQTPCGSADRSIMFHTHSCMCTHKNALFSADVNWPIKHKCVKFGVLDSDTATSTYVMQT